MNVTYSICGREIGANELYQRVLISEEVNMICFAVRRRMRGSAA